MKNNRSFLWIRGLIVLSLVIALTFGVVSKVQAAGSDEDGYIGADEIIYDDVFLSGNRVVMDGTVYGALFAAGNTVTINGTVNGDAILFGANIVISKTGRIDGNLITAGQTVLIEGEVTGSVAAGSASLALTSAKVGRNLYFGGFSLSMDEASALGIDLYSGVYQAMLKGSIGRDANVDAGAVEIDGSIGRNATINLGEAESQDQSSGFFMPYTPPGVTYVIEPGLRISEKASIAGKLTYTYPYNQSSNIKAQPEGGIVFNTPVPSDMGEPGQPARPENRPFNAWNLIFGRIMGIPARFWRDLSSLLILGGLAVWLAPSLLKGSVAEIRQRPLPSAGYGLVVTIGGYLAAGLAAVVLLMAGLFLNLFTLGALKTVTFGFGFTLLILIFLAFVVLVFFGSRLAVAYLVGDWILAKLAPGSPASMQPFWGLAIGVLLFAILHAIPVVGWFFGLVTTIFGMGAFWLLFLKWRKPVEPAAPVAVETPAA